MSKGWSWASGDLTSLEVEDQKLVCPPPVLPAPGFTWGEQVGTFHSVHAPENLPSWPQTASNLRCLVEATKMFPDIAECFLGYKITAD